MARGKFDTEDLRKIRAIEKLLHGFDLSEGSREGWLPKPVDLAHGRTGHERPWAYYVDLASRIYDTIDDFVEEDEPSPHRSQR